MNNTSTRFLVRWFVSSLGLWMAVELLGNESVSYGGRFSAVIVSGLIMALVNTFIKPVIVFFTLPAVLLTLGVFMVVINALTVLIAAYIYGPLQVQDFGIALLVGLMIGLVNWLVTTMLEDKK